METRRRRMCLVGLLVLIMLAGCIVSESYKTGQDLGRQNRWDEAIGYFETALKESPDNQEYKDALLKAKQEAAKVHYEKAKSQLAQSQESIPALQQISKESALAYNLDPTNKTIKSFNDNLKEKIESLNNQVKLLYSQSEIDMQKEDWLTALSKLKQVNKLFPGYEDTGARIAKIEQEGSKLFYQQGIALGKQEEWKSAAQAFKAVVDMNPGYYDAEKLYQDALSKDNGDYYMGAGDKAARAQNWDKAISMYEKALSYKPGDQSLATKVGALKDKVGRIYFEEAVKLSDQGKLYSAMKKAELVKAYTPSLQGDGAYRNFTGKLCQRLMDRAEKYSGKELWGNALVWYQ